jgi:pseudaminic acid cytidylyltransferase
MKVAIIPARGGSKRVPRKNIKLFCGKPMIAWSIEAALKSGCFDRVIVSTDDLEIKDVSIEYGAEVPFLRPAELSNDDVATMSVINHSIRYLQANQCNPEFICCIYATAPFLRSRYLISGFEALGSHKFSFAVTDYGFPIQRAIRIKQDNSVEMFWPENFSRRSQDLESAYHDAGQFYWGTTESWLENVMPFSAISAPVILPRYLVQDIDTMQDWVRAELMFKALVDLGV